MNPQVPPPTPGVSYALCLFLHWSKHPEDVFTTKHLKQMWGVSHGCFVEALNYQVGNGMIAKEAVLGRRGVTVWKPGPALLRRLAS